MGLYNGILSENPESYSKYAPSVTGYREAVVGGYTPSTMLGNKQSILNANGLGDFSGSYARGKNVLSQSAWDAGAQQRLSENIQGAGGNRWTAEMADIASSGGSVEPKVGGLSPMQGAVAGAAISAVGGLVQGGLEAAQNKKLRESAEANSMADIAAMRANRDVEINQLDATERFQAEQQKYQHLLEHSGLRMEMLQDDLAQELQDYQDKKSMVDKFHMATSNNEALKMALINRMGGNNG